MADGSGTNFQANAEADEALRQQMEEELRRAEAARLHSAILHAKEEALAIQPGKDFVPLTPEQIPAWLNDMEQLWKNDAERLKRLGMRVEDIVPNKAEGLLEVRFPKGGKIFIKPDLISFDENASKDHNAIVEGLLKGKHAWGSVLEFREPSTDDYKFLTWAHAQHMGITFSNYNPDLNNLSDQQKAVLDEVARLHGRPQTQPTAAPVNGNGFGPASPAPAAGPISPATDTGGADATDTGAAHPAAQAGTPHAATPGTDDIIDAEFTDITPPEPVLALAAPVVAEEAASIVDHASSVSDSGDSVIILGDGSSAAANASAVDNESTIISILAKKRGISVPEMEAILENPAHVADAQVVRTLANMPVEQALSILKNVTPIQRGQELAEVEPAVAHDAEDGVSEKPMYGPFPEFLKRGPTSEAVEPSEASAARGKWADLKSAAVSAVKERGGQIIELVQAAGSRVSKRDPQPKDRVVGSSAREVEPNFGGIEL